MSSPQLNDRPFRLYYKKRGEKGHKDIRNKRRKESRGNIYREGSAHGNDNANLFQSNIMKRRKEGKKEKEKKERERVK